LISEKKDTKEHLIQLGKEASLSKNKINEILDQTRTALQKWDDLAGEFGVSQSYRKMISKFILGKRE
jgi:serine/threonine-protein kinase HipA